ncbi:MAG TPA: GNAT family N-acetyltransferase [Devosia sp.]|jgi:predicted N-acetyltransferase YhbS|nr:GNAT family N-acetyltransferase [Devosia sp.]
MKLDIRIAHPDDRLNLSALKRRASLVGETGDVLQSLLEDPALTDIDEELLANNEVIVAEHGETIVGFISLAAQDGNDAEIADMFVEPSQWRKGIGRELMFAAEREAAAWGATRLHVVGNPNALAFYTALGFTPVGEQRTQLGPVAPVLAKTIAPR